MIDLGRVALARGQYESAVDQFQDAGLVFANSGRLEVLPTTCKQMLSAALASAEWSLITRAAVQTVIFGANLPEGPQTAVVGHLLGILKEAVYVGPAQKAHDGVYEIYVLTAAVLHTGKIAVSDPLKLLHQGLQMMVLWISGHVDSASKTAAALDEATRGVLGFAQFVQRLPPRIPLHIMVFRTLRNHLRSAFRREKLPAQ